jgi:hypothetical protein
MPRSLPDGQDDHRIPDKQAVSELLVVFRFVVELVLFVCVGGGVGVAGGAGVGG